MRGALSVLGMCLPPPVDLCTTHAVQVLRCKDHRTGSDVALKIIRNKKRFQKQAAVEAAILALLREQVGLGNGQGLAVGLHKCAGRSTCKTIV